MVKTQRAWTDPEQRELVALYQAGKAWGTIARKLGRTRASAESRLRDLVKAKAYGEIARPHNDVRAEPSAPARLPDGPVLIKGQWWFKVDRRTAYRAVIHAFGALGLPDDLTSNGTRYVLADGQWRAQP